MSNKNMPRLVLPVSTREDRRAASERSRSSAAGVHGKTRKDRHNTVRRAIEQSKEDG